MEKVRNLSREINNYYGRVIKKQKLVKKKL